MKNYILILLSFFYCCDLSAQRLEVINYVMKDTTEGEVSKDKWPRYRTYINDSLYCEEAFFYVNGSKYDVIKKVGLDWYLFNNGIWDCFYCNDTTRSIVIDRGYHKLWPSNRFKLEWKEKIRLCKLDVFIFQLQPIDFVRSKGEIYYFSPELGVVGWGVEKASMIGNDGLIIREDVKAQGDCAKCFGCEFVR